MSSGTVYNWWLCNHPQKCHPPPDGRSRRSEGLRQLSDTGVHILTTGASGWALHAKHHICGDTDNPRCFQEAGHKVEKRHPTHMEFVKYGRRLYDASMTAKSKKVVLEKYRDSWAIVHPNESVPLENGSPRDFALVEPAPQPALRVPSSSSSSIPPSSACDDLTPAQASSSSRIQPQPTSSNMHSDHSRCSLIPIINSSEMTGLDRFATSGSNWTTKDLLAFNIRVVDASAPTFFASTGLPPVSVSPTILNHIHLPNGQLSKKDRQFFQYLRAAEQATFEQSAVSDFTAFILEVLDYDDSDRIIRLNKQISFYMAGQRVDAKSDVCVMSDLDYHLPVLVQEDKGGDPEPQLIAQAIAAYYQNNYRRTRVGLPALPAIFMPGITMVGTAPIFYRILVSPQLLDGLVTATYPKDETVVLKFVPPVANKETYFAEGMRPLANRRIVLQCFEAFKASMVNF